MKRITLAGIYDCLLNQRYAIEIPAAIATPARRAIERMLSLPKLARPARFETGRAPVAVSLMTN
jgi:quinolinate synthase